MHNLEVEIIQPQEILFSKVLQLLMSVRIKC